MASSVGTVYVPVRPDLAGFGPALSSGIQKSTSGITSSLKKAFSGVAGEFTKAFAVSAIGLKAFDAVKSFITGSINAASDLNESMNKVNVVFGESASTIVSWSEDSAQAMGISQQAALETAGTFGNLFDAIGLADTVGADMSMTLVQLASDLASFNNANPQDVLDALRSGLVGETEPLRRFGIELTEATLKSFAMKEGMDANVTAMTQAEKVQLRYAAILSQTGNAQGDFARTSDDLANSQRILSAEWVDLQAEVGQALLPAVLDLTHAMSDIVNAVGPALTFVFEAIGDQAEVVAENVQLVADAFEVLGDIIPGLGSDAEEGTSWMMRLFHAGQDIASPFNVNPISKFEKVFADLTDSEAKAAMELEDWGDQHSELISAIQTGSPAFTNFRDRAFEIADGFLGLSQKTARARGVISGAQSVLANFLGIMDPGPVDAVTDSLKAQTRALHQLRMAQLAILDPVFATVEAFRSDVEASDELAAARKRVNRLQTAGKTGTNQYKEAVARLADATLGAAEAHAGLLASVADLRAKVDEGQMTLKQAKGALSDMGRAAGLTKGEIAGLQSQLRGAVGALNAWNNTPLDSKSAVVDIVQRISQRGHFIGAASGFHGWVSGPTPFLVGEAGRERVDITPASKSLSRASRRGGSTDTGPMTLRIVDWKNGLAELESELDWVRRGARG